MATIKIKYEGDLRTRCTHLQSGTELVTDAPVDNQGKGEGFSPTDLLANALGSCIITIMGIKAQQRGIDIDGTQLEVTKIMSSNPRRVAEVKIEFLFPKKEYSNTEKKILERVASMCPVAQSLHPNTKQSINFIWPS